MVWYTVLEFNVPLYTVYCIGHFWDGMDSRICSRLFSNLGVWLWL